MRNGTIKTDTELNEKLSTWFGTVGKDNPVMLISQCFLNEQTLEGFIYVNVELVEGSAKIVKDGSTVFTFRIKITPMDGYAWIDDGTANARTKTIYAK